METRIIKCRKLCSKNSFIRLSDFWIHTHKHSLLPPPRLLKHSLGKWATNQKEVVFSAKWAETPDDHTFKELKINRDLFFRYKIGKNATAFQFQINLFRYRTEQAENTISLSTEQTRD